MNNIYKHNLTIDFKQSGELHLFHNCKWTVKAIHKKDENEQELFQLFINNGPTTFQIIDIPPAVAVEAHIISFNMTAVATIMQHTQQKNPGRKFEHNISFIKNGKVDLSDYIPQEESDLKKRFKNVLSALKDKPTFDDFIKDNKIKP